jgi:hypothetical protein
LTYHKDILLPKLTTKRLVHSGREVAREQARYNEQAHSNAHIATTEAGVQYPKAAESQKTGSHKDELHARANEGREEATVWWWSEHIAMHQFPACDVFQFFVGRDIGISFCVR